MSLPQSKTRISNYVFLVAMAAGLVTLPLAIIYGWAAAWVVVGASLFSWYLLADTIIAAVSGAKAAKGEAEAFNKDLLAVMRGEKPTGPLAGLQRPS